MTRKSVPLYMEIVPPARSEVEMLPGDDVDVHLEFHDQPLDVGKTTEMPSDQLPSTITVDTVVEEDGDVEVTYSDEELIVETSDGEDINEDESEDEHKCGVSGSSDRNQEWGRFVRVCEEHKLDAFSAFAAHISDVNISIFRELMGLIRQLTPEEIMELTNKVSGFRPAGVKISPKGEDDEDKSKTTSDAPTISDSSSSSPSSSEPETASIRLQKGLTQMQIREFIVRINAELIEHKYSAVSVITTDWDRSSEHFALIPAAKKLFAKYVEAGLLGCLVTRGFDESAKKLYCIAYAKGRRNDDNVAFKGIDIEDYRGKARKSLAAYNQLMALVIKPTDKKK